jgi:hypothetical protein
LSITVSEAGWDVRGRGAWTGNRCWRAWHCRLAKYESSSHGLSSDAGILLKTKTGAYFVVAVASFGFQNSGYSRGQKVNVVRPRSAVSLGRARAPPVIDFLTVPLPKYPY